MEVENRMNSEEDSNLKARPYQTEILERALRQNVIVFLPTGSGKTYIAIMAIKEMSKALQKPLGQGGKRTVFLVNTVALARQQCESIRTLVNLKVSIYTGDMNVDNWKREKWRQEFEENQIVVATAQIILDVVRHGFLSITDFNLMIFDECHNATNDHPMNQLMGHFQNHPAAQLPRVIGLTGLLLKSSSAVNIEADLNMMEAVFRATIVTVSSYDSYQNVLVHSTKPVESVMRYKALPHKEPIYAKIEEQVNKCTAALPQFHFDMSLLKASTNLDKSRSVANPCKKHVNFWKDFIHKMHDMGIYGASIAILSFIVEFELKKRAAETTSIRSMSRLCISYAERIRHEVVEYMKNAGDFDADDPYELEELIFDNSSHKIQVLLGYIERTFTGKNPKEISCLVFVERRQTAKCLFYLVKHYIESKRSIPIVPEFMVGQSKAMPESIETWLDAKRQKNILRKFKRGDCNMLIASSVLEEGIDVQSCNYVIIYDCLKNFGAYVQTKGRARMQNSNYVIMTEEKELQKLLGKLQQWKLIEETLTKFLVGRTIDRQLPLQEEIDEQFAVELKPFYTPLGAVLEAGSVISLLNRYCMSLPQDSFTCTTVQWSIEITDDKKMVVKVSMPPQSTIKEDILSDKMSSIKMAKRSAAMKACIKLYENKELNEHLLPVSKENCFEFVEDIYFKHWNEFHSDDKRLAGTTKMRRLHFIKHPHQLTGATPRIGCELYMYGIQLTPIFPKDSSNEYIINLLTTSSNYAVLTCKELPELAKMPLFLSQGQVTGEINHKPVRVSISNEEELSLLHRFHVTLFRDVVETWHSFFATNCANNENSYFIAPTVNGTQIDWDLVRRCQGLQKSRQLTETQRKKLKLNPADYVNSVVCPWYTPDQNTRYVVLKVLTDITPLSPFPNGDVANYAAYVNDKYRQNVVIQDQFMLLVQPLTRGRSLIHPGEGETGRRNKVRRYDDIKLIPELCHNYKFPGDLWLKAVFLPTILHRMHYLLLAENLRVEINDYLAIKSENHRPYVLPVESKQKPQTDESMDVDKPSEEISEKVCLHIEKDDVMDATCQWQEYEEPLDLDRKQDEMYEIELDYYMQFIKIGFENLTIEGKEFRNGLPIPSKKGKVEAICDVSTESNYEIGLLCNHRDINQSELLAAITRSSANDVFNMERLELLGDSFLKFGTTLYIFNKHIKWNEGCLTALKSRLVSNRNLFYLSTRLNIAGMLNTEQFSPKNDWEPPHVSVPVCVQQAINSSGVSPHVLFKLRLEDDEVYGGYVQNETLNDFISLFAQEESYGESNLVTLFGKRWIGDKWCSDAVEAILGVCVKNLGIERGFKMLNFFGILPTGEDDMSKLINTVRYNPRLSSSVKDENVDALLVNYEDLENKLGYKFKDRAYLLQALTHPSYTLNRATGCYQCLEFLGDAVLDFLVSSFIFERCSHMGPGDLTDLRSALVNNSFLACLTVRYGFHTHLLSQSATLLKAIEHFARFQESENHRITDQVRLLMQEDECSIADFIEVPKALGDLFESLVAAVFLDCGNDLKRTWIVIYNLMSQEIGQYVQNVPKQLVRELIENKPANAMFMPAEVDDDIVMVRCQFTCRGTLCEVNGFGQNTRSATISAAKLALQELKK